MAAYGLNAVQLALLAACLHASGCIAPPDARWRCESHGAGVNRGQQRLCGGDVGARASVVSSRWEGFHSPPRASAAAARHLQNGMRRRLSARGAVVGQGLRLRGGEDEVDDCGSGVGGRMLYKSRWSSEHASSFLEVSPDGASVTCPPEPWQPDPDVDYPPAPEDHAGAWSARAEEPIPAEGEHYFEVVLEEDGKSSKGETLSEGWNTVGLVGDAESNWEGFWWSDHNRSLHSWGLHDAQNLAFSYKSDPTSDIDRWARGGSFGHGDRIGFLVDMATRTAKAFKNGILLGTAFTDLPPTIYPLATLVAENIKATISFPPPPSPAYIASAPLPLILGTPGTPGSAYGVCTKPGHSERGCYGLCNASEILDREEYERLFGEEDRLADEYEREMYENLGVAAMWRGKATLKRIKQRKGEDARPGTVVDLPPEGATAQRGIAGRGGSEGDSTLKDSIHAAPNYATIRVPPGTYRWQIQKTCLEADAVIEKDPDAEVWTEKDYLRTWHWYDAIVFPKGCGNEVVGAGRDASVLWGRWQMRNESRGGLRDATLLSEPPVHQDCTVEVWGEWQFDDCNIRCAGGGVLQTSHNASVTVWRCWVGGDGNGARRARRGIEVFDHARAKVADSIISHVGMHIGSVALRATHWGKLEVERTTVSEVDMCARLEWGAHVTIKECTLHEPVIAFFYQRDSVGLREESRRRVDKIRCSGMVEQAEALRENSWYEDSLTANSTMRLEDNQVYMNQLGEEGIWTTHCRPETLIEANQTYIEHPNCDDAFDLGSEFPDEWRDDINNMMEGECGPDELKRMLARLESDEFMPPFFDDMTPVGG